MGFYTINETKPDRGKWTPPRLLIYDSMFADVMEEKINELMADTHINVISISPPVHIGGTLITRYTLSVLIQERIGLPIPIAERDDEQQQDLG